ncbi:ATP-binding protein [Roseiflexus castenholzii]|jgi:hypothetical protein|uniref:ATPase (AAA+ superfamily)-like protein n=1 Tax=Roseiflexus castenholzii (strain DSM 13941 / HLO8) TaxID=383372 RepID=A7NJM7_ROSCS|nr:DUF499 domain-containing protein [Roseiflexus castenholzii]ABU57697.1 ATPase (AAA+ superfamily)-like protein [Roseiflexus castenholzii DSM 13941]
MTAFHTIAVPHDDILQGRLTLDVFAADLWEVYHRRGPEEYRDPDLFFQKTYLTDGLKNLFAVVEKRLKGQGGDPVIQMQTPFGGGKTHALIALYHKAREWGVKTAVIVGTPLAARETLWGLLAEQLTDSRARFEGFSAPGRESLRALLSAHQPLLILMDEVLEYAVKAAAEQVGGSTLAAQTLAFLQELTEAASILERVSLVITLPSSTLEQYDEQATRLFEQLKKISGRVEKVYTPVRDEEVGAILRRRLFSRVDEKAAAKIVNAFMDEAEQEALLPRGEESAAYRARFKATYPFLPEVVDVLYHRWGSFPNFQRTRGTLRLLGMVVHALKNSSRPYITLADFPLQEDEIRRELLKHIGNEYDSVLAADLLSAEAGARKANQEIGKAYQGLGLGERIASTIFMHSFVGGGGEAGATAAEVKRHNLMAGVPASVIAEVLNKLSSRLLFYLHEEGGRYYFSTTANLNRALTIRMENVTAEELRAAELDSLRKRVSGKVMRTFLWPEQSADIPDDPQPKLLILPAADPARMKHFVEEKGQTPRVHRNTLFFLTPHSERAPFENLLRRHLALSALLAVKTLSLTPEQRKELQDKEKQAARDLQEQIGSLYRLLYLPDPQGMALFDLGIPTYGGEQYLEERVYERLRTEGRLLEKLAPLVIKQRYLSNRDYVETRQLAESGSRTPGEPLVTGRHVWETCIAEGVRQGLFGLGELDENGQPQCRYFKEEVTPSLRSGEVLIRAEVCARQKTPESYTAPVVAPGTVSEPVGISTAVPTTSPVTGGVAVAPAAPGRNRLRIRFNLPFGKASSLFGLFNLLQTRFGKLHITIEAEGGSMSETEIEDKVRETFRQIGTDVEIE